MTGRPARREPLYGARPAAGTVPAGPRSEPRHARGLADGAGRLEPGPAHHAALYGASSSGPAASSSPAASSGSSGSSGSRPAAGTVSPGTGPGTVAARLAAELADAYRARLELECLAGTGRSTGPAGLEPLAGLEPPARPTAARTRLELADDARRALADRPQLPQERPAAAGPTAGTPTGPHASRGALVLELAGTMAAAGLELEAARADARDRHAVAILAEAGPLAVTGRPVHALQLADGRAFLLEHDEAGRPQWRPTGPRPLLGCPTPAGPWPDEDGPDEDGPQLAGRPQDRPQDGPDGTPAALWDRIRARQRDRSTSTQRERHERPQDGVRDVAGPSTHGTGPTAGAGTQDGPACPITGRPCSCSGAGPCPPSPPGPPLVGILSAWPWPAQDGPDVGEDGPVRETVAAYRPQERPQELEAGTPGPSRRAQPLEAGTGPQDRPQARTGLHPLAVDAVRALVDAAQCSALLAGPQDGEDGPALHPCPLADGAPCSLRPGSLGCCEDGPQELAQDGAGPATPAQAPQDGSGRPGRPSGPTFCHVDGSPCAPACEDGSASPCQVVDAPQLADVDDLADAMRPAALLALPEDGPELERLADDVRQAGTWTRNTYARRIESAAILHREPLHAFTDAIERDRADLRRVALASLPPMPATPRGGIRYPRPAPQDGPPRPLSPIRGDRRDPDAMRAALVAQLAQDDAQTAHDHATTRAQACTCLHRGPGDAPCPVAGPPTPDDTPEA